MHDGDSAGIEATNQWPIHGLCYKDYCENGVSFEALGLSSIYSKLNLFDKLHLSSKFSLSIKLYSLHSDQSRPTSFYFGELCQFYSVAYDLRVYVYDYDYITVHNSDYENAFIDSNGVQRGCNPQFLKSDSVKLCKHSST